jgi:hypothetical protein
MKKRVVLQREKPAYLEQFGLRISGSPGVQSIGCGKGKRTPVFRESEK